MIVPEKLYDRKFIVRERTYLKRKNHILRATVRLGMVEQNFSAFLVVGNESNRTAPFGIVLGKQGLNYAKGTQVSRKLTFP